MQISEIEYASHLSYAPHPQQTSKSQSYSKQVTIMLKNDAVWPKSNLTASEYIIRQMAQEIDKLPIADFFKNKPILVPVPRSSLMKPWSLWVHSAFLRHSFKGDLEVKQLNVLNAHKHCQKQLAACQKTDQKQLIITTLSVLKHYPKQMRCC